MMKNMFSRLGRQSRTVVRQLSSGGAALPNAAKCSGRFLVQSQKQVQFGTPFVRQLGAIRGAHDQRTKGDEELLGFLEEEIATEKKMARSSTFPTSFEGFAVKVESSELTLTKKVGNEEITITANVNHSVDAEYNEEPNVKQAGKDSADEMKSKPNFQVEIARGKKVLHFSCSYLQNAGEGEGNQEEFSDIFSIDEVSIYEGEMEENDYAVAGDILDGYLYDLFMNMLEERGVNNELMEKFSDLCTDYEHKQYVDLLVKLQGFLGSK